MFSKVIFTFRPSGFRAAGMFILLGLTVTASWADVVFSTGFEAPDYSLGALGGQDHWTSNGTTALVEDTLVHSGTQAMQIPAISSNPGQTDVFRAGPAIDTSGGITVVLTADLYVASSSLETDWVFGADMSDGSEAGEFVLARNGSILFFSPPNGFQQAAGTFQKDQWNTVSLIFNFGTATYDGLLDGATIFSGAHLANAGTTFEFPLFADFGSGNDSLYVDNLSVTVTPEPAYGALLGAAFVGVLAIARKKRGPVRSRPALQAA